MTCFKETRGSQGRELLFKGEGGRQAMSKHRQEMSSEEGREGERDWGGQGGRGGDLPGIPASRERARPSVMVYMFGLERN